jgi:hypothetical protein
MACSGADVSFIPPVVSGHVQEEGIFRIWRRYFKLFVSHKWLILGG